MTFLVSVCKPLLVLQRNFGLQPACIPSWGHYYTPLLKLSYTLHEEHPRRLYQEQVGKPYAEIFDILVSQRLCILAGVHLHTLHEEHLYIPLYQPSDILVLEQEHILLVGYSGTVPVGKNHTVLWELFRSFDEEGSGKILLEQDCTADEELAYTLVVDV